MGQRLSTCLRRHRRKFFIVGGVIGSIAFLNAYMRRRFVEWEKKTSLEYVEQLKKQGHFEGTLQTCDQALLSFTGKIRDIIIETMNVAPLVAELKTKPANKLELWEELKIMVFTQIITEMYAQCLLVILLRVQLSILGGHIYSECQKIKPTNSENASENQQKYLTHVSNFLSGGIKNLIIPVEDAVRKSLRGTKLSTNVTLADFHKYFRETVDNISHGNSGIAQNISQYLMMYDQSDSSSRDLFLDKMDCETRDVLECEDFQKVFGCCLEHGIAVLMDRISECYMHLNSSTTNFLNPHNHAIPFVKIIPMICNVFVQHQPNEQGSLVYILLQQETLKMFSANLYEAFSEADN